MPLAIGFVWYNPKVFGTAWIKSTGLTDEQLKGGNMLLILGLTYFFGLLLTMSLHSMVIHQMSFYSVLMADPKTAADNKDLFESLMTNYGTLYRTFKHGALHGTIAAVFFALPILGVNALFERKDWKYILIHLGYWTVTLAIMGGIVCQFG